MAEIKITIDKAGKITIDTAGFSGTACKDATRAIEAALGAVTGEEIKPELYQNDTQSISQRGW